MPHQAREAADNAQHEALIRRPLRQSEQTPRASFGQSPPNEPHTLGQIEDPLQQIGERIKGRGQEGVADQQGAAEVGERARCPCAQRARCPCAEPARRVARYARQLLRRPGPVPLFRACQHCGAWKKGSCPSDQRPGPGSGQWGASGAALPARLAA